MKKNILFLGIALGTGLLIGWVFFHSHSKIENNKELTTQKSNVAIWTCSMHPQIRMTSPGKCPICGMDLIPLSKSGVPMDSGAIQLSKEAVKLANVLTSKVTRQNAVKEIRLYGKVKTDERLLQSQVAHISGRIEKLLINFKGESVTRGQPLALIYSPELITAQQELLEVVKIRQSQPEIYEAAKEKLRQLKLTENQIESIERTGSVQNNIEIVSNTNGIVSDIPVKNGDYISAGTILFNVFDISHVWIMFDAYESDLEFLNKGDKIAFKLQAIPGRSFAGNIVFIDPVIDPVTRVAKVRIEVNNEAGSLKPEMFAIGIVTANLSGYKNNLVIPNSAVLWTGKRSIVYVKQTDSEEPVFKMREIEIGPMLGNSYIVVKGLTEGEEIVTQGAFSVDASAQLEGKPSMMNSEGGKVPTGDKSGNSLNKIP
jgi:Cu(I)/Ag(I) efflux system membrane fusion protein